MGKKNFSGIGAAFACLLALTGCGKVAGPLSPLFNPPVASFGSFDDGGPVTWFFDSSSPVNLTSPSALTLTDQPTFQGAGALEIPIVHQQGGEDLTSYSVGVTFAPLDLTGKVLSMWVYFKSGLVNPPDKVGAQLFLKDTSYYYANGTFWNLTPGQWTQVTYNVAAPSYQNDPPPDLSSIYEVGLQIAGSGGASFTSDGVIIADSFGYQ